MATPNRLLILQEYKQRNHTLAIDCARLNGLVHSLHQESDQEHQNAQTAQSTAAAASDAARRQAAQITTLTHTVEELRREVEASEAEQQRLQARVEQMVTRRGLSAATDSEAHQDAVRLCPIVCASHRD